MWINKGKRLTNVYYTSDIRKCIEQSREDPESISYACKLEYCNWSQRRIIAERHNLYLLIGNSRNSIRMETKVANLNLDTEKLI